MILPVPYLSQHIEASDPYWQERACAVVNIKMIGEFLAPGIMPSVDQLVREGESIGGFTQHGWRHDALVILLRNYGILAYSEEYRTGNPATLPRYTPSRHFDSFTKAAIAKFVSELEAGRPVIVSVPGKKGLPDQTHMVVLVGYEPERDEIKGFYYHDPDGKSETEGRKRFFLLPEFLKGWRRFAIFLE